MPTAARRNAFWLIVAALIAVNARAAELDDLPFNRAQFKAAHNSIDRGISLADQLAWSAESPHQGGCCGIELDIVADTSRLGADDPWRFCVQHGGTYSEEAPQLRDALAELRAFSDADRRHRVIMLHVDLKNRACHGDVATFCTKIDEIFTETLGRERIFTPAELQRDAETLLDGARRYGWPTLGQLRGKFIICFSGEDLDPKVYAHKEGYATTDPAERLAFVDYDMRYAYREGQDAGYIENPYYNRGTRVFINLQRGRPGWLLLGKRAAEEGGFVTRVWQLNTEESWRDGQRAGINVLATDMVRDHEWAQVGREPHRKLRVGW